MWTILKVNLSYDVAIIQWISSFILFLAVKSWKISLRGKSYQSIVK